MSTCPSERLKDISELKDISPHIYSTPENIIKLVRMLQGDNLVYTLPLCQTVEGQGYGGIINTSTKPLIPRFSIDTYKKMEELPLPLITPDIEHIISAIEVLASEKQVIVNLMGPITALTSICNNGNFYQNWRKDKLLSTFNEYRKFIFSLGKRYIDAGATIISYSDPIVTKGILGNNNFAKGTKINLEILDDLKKLEVPLYLCPRFVRELAKEYSQKEVITFAEDNYLKHISKLKGKIVSGLCIKSLTQNTDKINHIK